MHILKGFSLCNYLGITGKTNGRWKSFKVHFALIYFFGFETYCPIGR
jgi:hypothetical protein